MKNADIGRLDFFINHSLVRPNIMPDGVDYIDVSLLEDRPDVEFFTYPTGAILFTGNKIDVYYPFGIVKHQVMSAIKSMFLRGLDKIIAEIPSFNRKSHYMAVNLGFREASKKQAAWQKNGILYDIINYELRKT